MLREIAVDAFNFQTPTLSPLSLNKSSLSPGTSIFGRPNPKSNTKSNTKSNPKSNPMILDYAGGSPISKALENHHYALARGLLIRALRMGFLTYPEQTSVLFPAMSAACRKGDIPGFDILADYLTVWNIQDEEGKSLLHIATLEGQQEIVSSLLFRPSLDLSLCDNEGHTAFDVAVLKGYQELEEILRKEEGARKRNRS